MTSQLSILAQRVEHDPFFLACPLRLYATSEGLAEEQLAGALGCSTDTLVLLRLCRAPVGKPEVFQKGIEEISARFRVNADFLAEVVRRGQAISQLRRPGDRKSTLAAARDGETPKDDNRQQGGEV
jgi:hypothetical protein